MNPGSSDLPLDRALRAAYGPAAGCPPPEAYLELESGALDPAERSRLEEHAASCPGCAAERELARAGFRTELHALTEFGRRRDGGPRARMVVATRADRPDPTSPPAA